MTMEIHVDRFTSDDDTTLSLVMVDGRFVCFGFEDECRQEKPAGETRIPAGKYRVILRKEGRRHLKYQQRFHDIHKGMLHILNVPDFKGVLILCGNTEADTAGCLLVGGQARTEPGDMKIMGSVAAYRRFYSLVVAAAENKTLTLTVVDNDR